MKNLKNDGKYYYFNISGVNFGNKKKVKEKS